MSFARECAGCECRAVGTKRGYEPTNKEREGLSKGLGGLLWFPAGQQRRLVIQSGESEGTECCLVLHTYGGAPRAGDTVRVKATDSTQEPYADAYNQGVLLFTCGRWRPFPARDAPASSSETPPALPAIGYKYYRSCCRLVACC